MTDCDGLITNLRNANNAAGGVLDLEAIKARAAAATEGPWEIVPPGDDEDFGTDWWVNFPNALDDSTSMAEAEAVFIAAARSDVPALVAEVERLRAIVEARP